MITVGRTHRIDPYDTDPDSGLVLPKSYLDKKHDKAFYVCWCEGKHWTEEAMLACNHKGGKVRGRIEL